MAIGNELVVKYTVNNSSSSTSEGKHADEDVIDLDSDVEARNMKGKKQCTIKAHSGTEMELAAFGASIKESYIARIALER